MWDMTHSYVGHDSFIPVGKQAYIEPLNQENTTLRDEREEWTLFIAHLQTDHDSLITGVCV